MPREDQRPAGRPIRSSFLVRIGAAAIAVGPWCGARAQPALDPSIADRFEVTTFASGLNFPTSMHELSDGSIVVATNDSAIGNFFVTTGTLLRFVDADNDGVADGPGQVLASGLPGGVTSIRQAGDLFFATSTQGGSQRITVLRGGASSSDPLTAVGAVNLGFPAGWEHLSYALAVRESPTIAGAQEVFFNVGSQFNFDPTISTVTAGGLLSGPLEGDSIYRFTVTDGGAGAPTLSGLEQIATGLRNAAGIAFDPVTGDLVFQDNGIDTPSNRNEPLSADELNRIVLGDIGGAVEDFGFPGDFISYRTGGQGPPGSNNPLVAFQPFGDPLTGLESEGANEIAFAPSGFDSILGGRGIFVGFHGKFSLGGLNNEENPLVFYNLDTDSYFHFIPGRQPGMGHLDGLLATGDSLYVADLSTIGALTGAANRGVIYRIRPIAIPEPASLAMLVIGIAGGWLSIRRGPR